MRLRDRILKQHNIGETWGRFALAGSQIAVMVSTYTMLMVTVNAYEPISAWFTEKGINLSFWVFMAIIIVPIIIAYFIAWKYLVVSFYRSSVEQFMEQNEELMGGLKKIADMEKTLVSIQKTLEKMQKK